MGGWEREEEGGEWEERMYERIVKEEFGRTMRRVWRASLESF